MVEAPGKTAVEAHRQLVERVLASSHLKKSARLSELFSYLCERVLDNDVHSINELELGNKVFGRPARYDTTADNIVRVHASLLRKRLAEYFQTEGRAEEFVVEIPRGNYAPVFRPRTALERFVDTHEEHTPEPRAAAPLALPEQTVSSPVAAVLPGRIAPDRRTGWPVAIGILALLFAGLSAVLYVRLQKATSTETGAASPVHGPAASQFWSTVFPVGQPVDVVSDDASLGFYSEATGSSVRIGDYFDRTYMRGLVSGPGPAEHDPNWLHQLVIRRQSNYAATAMVWKLSQIAAAERSDARLQFARDLAFRQAKTDSLVLLGTPSSDPWIQLFESSTTLHWSYDPVAKAFYPFDTTMPGDHDHFKPPDESKTHESYATVALLPNLGGTGRTLILSGSGGAATDAAMDWLMQDSSLQLLLSRLSKDPSGRFPYFEALLRVEKGVDRPRSVTVAICRPFTAQHSEASH